MRVACNIPQGETGQSSLKAHPSEDKAVADFMKKFKEKTRNNWHSRENFVPMPGKYTLIEMETEDDNDEDEIKAKVLIVVIRAYEVISVSTPARKVR